LAHGQTGQNQQLQRNGVCETDPHVSSRRVLTAEILTNRPEDLLKEFAFQVIFMKDR
jgi:hypothetical protein